MTKLFFNALGAARATVLVFFLAALPGNSAAVALNAGDQADVQRIESYLNGITTLKSRFIQQSSTGHLASGVLYLSRPGRMRFEYDPPAQILLVANGLFLIYVDKELQQISNVPIAATPLSVLVDASVKLANSHDVEKVERGAGILSVTLGIKDDPESGAVRLLFADNPITLKKWYIIDAQGVEVQVSLLDSERGMTFDPALFQVDPTMFEDSGNQP